MNLQENILRIKEVMGIKTPEQNIIVEASKKDILVNKIGFSEKNAEFLVSLAGPFSVWIANKLLDRAVKQRVHMIKVTGNYTEQQKEEMINDLLSNAGEYKKETLSFWNKEYEVPGYEKSIFQEGYGLIQGIRHVMDWIRVGLNGNVKPYKDLSFGELMRLSTEWHDSLEVSGGEYNYNEENEIVRDYRDENGLGFYWVNLNKNQSTEECRRMGHCATTTGNNTLLSLRKNKELNKDNTHNKSYLTAALGKEDGLIYQLKGPKNSKPSEKFHEYIVDLILNYDKIKGFGEEEWGNERDFKITDLPKQEIVKVYSKKPELFNTKELKNYLKNEMGGESTDPNDVSVEDKSLQESIRRILREETSSEQIKDVILNGTDFDDWIRAIKMQYGDIVPLFHATTKENSKLIDKEGFKLVDGKNYKSFGKEPILYFQIGKSDYQAKNRPVLYRLDVPFDFLYHAEIDMDGPNISDEILFKYVDEETWDDLPYEIKDAIKYFIWNDFKLDGTEIFITNRFLNDLTDNIFNNLKPVKIID
jgi:hypothetical protein